LRLNLNRVSDDDYWRDFPRSSTSLTSRLLASEAVLNWGRGPWSLEAGVHQWQTLQDVEAPITPPYDRLPSLAVRYARNDARIGGLGGWDWSVRTEATRFRADEVAHRTGKTAPAAWRWARSAATGKRRAATSNRACSCTPRTTGWTLG
jgi:LPS-assembly protein